MKQFIWNLNKKVLMFAGFLLIGIVMFSFASGFAGSGSFSSVNRWQYNQPNFQSYYGGDIDTYWPILNDIENDQCDSTTSDFFILKIPHAGCSPMVVRSDLLAEQNVPVFCRLDSLQINPLIKVSEIKSLSFKGDYPDEVVGVSFHPSRAAVKTYKTLLGDPLVNNIGYVVIILKRNPKEDELPDEIKGNLTGTLYYDAEDAFGVGKAEFFLPVVSDKQWLEGEFVNGVFWNGKGHVRVSEIDEGRARVEIYGHDKEDVLYSVVLQEGETSGLHYLPNYYCRAGLRVKLNEVTAPEDKVLLNVDGDLIWVRDGSKFLDNKCSVRDLEVNSDESGKVRISCNWKSFELFLTPRGKAVFEDEGERVVETGKFVVNNEGENWYLGYAGRKSEGFVVLVKSDDVLSEEEIAEVYGNVQEALEENNLKGLESNNVKVLSEDESLGGVTFKGFDSEFEDATVGRNEAVDEYLDRSMEKTRELVDLYPNEGGLLERYGEIGIWEQIEAAEKFGAVDMQEDLINLLVKEYPDSEYISRARILMNRAKNYDIENAGESVYVDNEFHFISAVKFNKLDKSEKKVVLKVEGEKGEYGEGDKIEISEWDKDEKEYLGEIDSERYFLVDKIDVDEVEIEYYEKDRNGVFDREKSYRINESEFIALEGGRQIRVESIDVAKVARVSLIPEVSNTKTEANFTFNIGIEKRGIDLSPDKTREMMENLEDTIEQWEDINEKLGNLIKGWKGACFATSSILMVKNWMGGLSGEAMARQKVMESYRARCDALINQEKKYSTRTQCYNDLSSEINSDVSSYTEAIQNVNENIKSVQNGYIEKGGLLEGDYVKPEAFDEIKNKEGVVASVGDKQIMYSDLQSWEDYRSVLLVEELESKGVEGPVLEEAIKKRDARLVEAYNIGAAERKARELAGSGDGLKPKVKVIPRQDVVRTTWDGQTVKQVEEMGYSLDEGDNRNVQFFSDSTASYLLVLNEGSLEDGVGVEKIYKINGKNLDDVSSKDDLDHIMRLSFVEGGSCENEFINPEVRYYETGKDEKLPAIVPFDLKKGWYVRVPNALGGLTSSNQQGYAASGMPTFFYICNVGPNGVVSSEDNCQSFDVNSYDSVSSFSGCSDISAGEVRRMAEKAQEAIRQAAQQYGKKSVTIFGEAIEVGTPYSGGSDLLECQDFMSPEECKILFNVCDPVICPPSRCDLGGEYPVSNVAQTGIIGSIFLCLPNVKDGVMVPVCLTGIHAGIESFVSILRSEYDCLKASLESGEHVGMCDVVTSIYLCEFFWRQVAPIVNIVIPRMIELAYGQGARGGGEYLTVSHSWNSLQEGISYFKDNYAQNAFRAFQYKNIEEAGGSFCRGFIGSSFPTSAESLDMLLEPESPYQFYGQFSEIPFTDATVPPTSQYKVYYHIFAGNDRGVQYAVYLKDPPASSYYSTTERIMVDSGFVSKGDEVDRSKDFTGPSGYKQLCVSVNGEEKCGFKQVTTNFAVDYLNKKYREDQANQTRITTEKECISGSPSLLPMANLNVQAGAEESVQPSIALRGIVRVCASQNPGIDKDNPVNERWKEVGYCGDESLKCWLDTKSVEKDVETVQGIEDTLSGAEGKLNQLDVVSLIAENDSIAMLGEVEEKMNKLKEKIRGVSLKEDEIDKVIQGGDDVEEESIIGKLRILQDKAYLNKYRAEAYLFEGRVYRIVLEVLYEEGLGELKKQVKNEVRDAKSKDDDGDDNVGDEAGIDLGGVRYTEKYSLGEEEIRGTTEVRSLYVKGVESEFYLQIVDLNNNRYVLWAKGIGWDYRVVSIFGGKFDRNTLSNDFSRDDVVNDLIENYNLENGELVLKEEEESDERNEDDDLVFADGSVEAMGRLEWESVCKGDYWGVQYSDGNWECFGSPEKDASYDDIIVMEKIDKGNYNGVIIHKGNYKDTVGSYMARGFLTITGGIFESSVGSHLDGGRIFILGGEFKGEVLDYMADGDVLIEGGTFKKSVGREITDGTITINDGIFNKEILESEFIKDNRN